MSDDGFRVRFWGTRGSVPVSGPDYQQFGGNTCCVEMICGGAHLLFDAGSGIRQAGEALLREGIHDINLFFTHCHYDHIIGLPFFKPLYFTKMSIALWSGHLAGTMSTEDMVREFMQPPWLPAEAGYCRGGLKYHDFRSGDVLTPAAGVQIKTAALNHNGGCIGYRVEHAGHAVAVVFDVEHRDDVLDQAVLELMQDADLVVYDSTYTEEEMPRHIGFGHSTPQHGIKLAKAANVSALALFHHLPSRTDSDLRVMEKTAQAEFPNAFAAADGQIVDVLRATRKPGQR